MPIDCAAMNATPPVARLGRDTALRLAGGIVSLGVAALLFTRFSLYGWLTRDETIYIYAGQQLTHGVAPYASIYDPKGPLATILSGLGAAIAQLFGRSDVLVIRLLFLVLSVLSAVALYALVVQLWNSVLAGIVSAVVFSSFEGYAHNAIQGPDAKTPGVLFLIIAMWLAVRRQWFWAAFAGSLAFFVWQPLFPFPIVVIIAAAVYSVGARRRAVGLAVAGAVTPAAILVIYFAAAGALSDFINSAFVFPLTGVSRPPETVAQRIHTIVSVVRASYHFSGVLFWIGIVLLLVTAVIRVALARTGWRAALLQPYVLIVIVTFLAEAGYALYDFQGFPDVFPLLPYPAIGFGAATVLIFRMGQAAGDSTGSNRGRAGRCRRTDCAVGRVVHLERQRLAHRTGQCVRGQAGGGARYAALRDGQPDAARYAAPP